MASFEETIHPGYDEAFNKNKHKPSTVKLISETDMDKLIKEELYGIIFQLLTSGHELNKEQKKQFKYIMSTNMGGPIELNRLLEENIDIPNEYMGLSVFKNFKFYQHIYNISNNMDIRASEKILYPKLYNKIKNLMINNELNKIVFNEVKELAMEHSRDKQSRLEWALFEKMDEMKGFFLKGTSEEKIKSFIHMFSLNDNKEIKVLVKTKIDGYLKMAYKEDFNRKVDEYIKNEEETKNTENINKDLTRTEVISKNATNFNMKNELPSNLKEKITKISEVFSFLEQNKSKLDISSSLDYQRLYKETLPLILNQYYEIKVEKRNIKNEKGETPTEVLKEAIYTIYDILEETGNSINYNNLSNLSADSRYFEEIKKGIKP